MAEAALDMTLDDLIKKNKTGTGGKPRGRGRGAAFASASSAGPSRRFPNRSANRAAPYSIAKAPEASWNHDIFAADQAVAFGQAGGRASSIETGTKLYISNLDYGVSNEDIKELFSEIGDLKRYAVHYDRSGRSKGTAEVVFSRRQDALAGVKRFNNVQLDGKPMKIEIVGTNIVTPTAPFSDGAFGFGDTNGVPRRAISKRSTMATVSTARSSAYLTALTQEIEKKIHRALTSPSQRRNLLQELFADIALEVDDRAKEIILGTEDAIMVAEERAEGPTCYYYVLADHFVHVPQNGKPILDLIVQLWSQSFAANIFSLLFHKWLFEVQLENSEVLLRYSSALVQGATNVFWIDIQTNTRRFQSLFKYLLEEVALVPDRLKKIPLQAQRDLFLFLSRFIFFYNLGDKLGSFLRQFPDFPNAFLIGGAADIFVTELADQLQKLKVEPVLLHYLSQLKVLQGLELRMATSTRLKTCLYSFTSPGAPMYPTRAVRHAARGALDLLYPVGRYPRHIISLFFRLLYPWYWPSSFWNFIKSCILAVFYSLLRLIFSSRDKVRSRPKEQ